MIPGLKRRVQDALRDRPRARRLVQVAHTRLRKVIPDHRLLCVLYGNCQIEPLCDWLDAIPAFSKRYRVSCVPPVHTIGADEIEAALHQVDDSDLFVHQHVSERYRDPQLATDLVKKRLKQSCHAISFPSLYFAGYSPELVHLFNEDGSAVDGPLGQYHSLFVLRSYLQGMSADQSVSRLKDVNALTAAAVRKIAAESIVELRKREEAHQADVRVSDFIESNYRRLRLFHTMNHSGGVMIRLVARRILQALSLSGCPENEWVFEGGDTLDDAYFPVHPAVYNALDLTFANPRQCRVFYRDVPVEDVVQAFFNSYDACSDVAATFERSRSRFTKANEEIIAALT